MSSGSVDMEALESFRQAMASERLAHAFLLVAPPRETGCATARALAALIMCEAPRPAQRPCGQCRVCRNIESGSWADMLWIEPVSKSRQIVVDDIRDRVIPFVGKTSYEGGWKVLVVEHAEGMNEEASNALLKTLEEPASWTLMLLLTDSPERLLPTIRSRCQRLVLHGVPGDVESEEWYEPLLNTLASGMTAGVVGRYGAAFELTALFVETETKVEDEVKEQQRENYLGNKDALDALAGARARAVRRRMLAVILDWQREVLACAAGARPETSKFPGYGDAIKALVQRGGYAGALEKLRRFDDAVRMLDRNMGHKTVWTGFFR